MAPAAKVPPENRALYIRTSRIQRGVAAKIKLIGTNLIGLTDLKLHNAQLKGELLNEPERRQTKFGSGLQPQQILHADHMKSLSRTPTPKAAN